MTAEAGVAPAAVWRNRIVGHADIAPAALVPNPRNWRTHPDDQQRALSGALAEVGWVAEVLVNQTTGHVVDGHLRLELALARGEPTVPVTYVDLSEDEERLVLASLDPLAAMARAEKEQLATLLAGLDPSDAALRAVLDDLAREFGLGTDRGGLVDPDVVPELPAEAFVSRGSLYELGDHRLLCGDSTDPTDVARLAGGGLADCLWTDPPYGVAYEGKTERHLRIRNDDPETSDDVIAGAFRLAPLGPSAPFYVSAPAGPRSAAFRAAIAAADWRLHQELVWVKGTIVLGHSDYQYAHEPILYGYTAGSGRPGRGRHPGSHWYGDNGESSVLEYPKPAANRDHPTAKPVALVAHCLRNSTRPGDLVYEPFAGSGTTLIAAEQLGRRCFAMEIDPRYAQVTIERWQAFTGREAVKVDA
ncbi:MAG TPA: DNA modification methylase [Candidatus Limnocylindrales bacterium]|jgi:DNA modification methylase|nr:DNA modification methylase [Candidatus Limnocylindrales bacterium]